MLNAIQGVKLCAYCFKSIETLCSLLYMNFSIMLIAISGMKLYG